MWNPITGKSNSILSYAKWLGDIGYKVAGVDEIKRSGKQIYNLADHLLRDKDGQLFLRKGAYQDLVLLYHNAPDVNGRLNFLNSMFRTGLKGKDVDKTYRIDKSAAQISFALALSWITFAAIDFVDSPLGHVLRDAGALSAALMMMMFFVKNSFTAYQYRTYNLCTFKQWITTENNWWSEAFKTKVGFDPLKVIMTPKLLSYSNSNNSANQQLEYRGV